RKVSVIDPHGFQIQHLRRQQRCKPDGSGSADNQLRKTLSLYVFEHMQYRRKAELLQFILGQLEFTNRSEIPDRYVGNVDLLARSNYDEIRSRLQSSCRHFPNRGRHAVDILKGIRKPGALRILERLGKKTHRRLAYVCQTGTRWRLTVEPVKVRPK